MAIIIRHKSTIYGLTTDLANLQAADAAETAARIAADSAEEAARIAGDNTLTTNLAAEVTRATAAEATLTTNLAAEISRATGAEQALDLRIDALGSAFNYVGAVTGGANAGAAFDLATLATGAKDAGDYYKVTTAGYFKVGTGDAFYANINDGLVWNLAGGVDVIDNTNSQVNGTADFIAVTGSSDTGFVVDVDTAFKGRVSTLESGLAQEILNRAAADTALDTSLKAYADNAATQGGSVPRLESLVVASNKIVLTSAPKNGINGVLNFATVRHVDVNGVAYDAPVTIDGADATGKTLIVSVDASGDWDGKSVTVQYLYVNAA